MEKKEVWENIKKYAKVFFQGVGLFFAYVFHYIAVFAKFVYKHLKKLFKKLYRIIRRHIRRVKKHMKAGDYSLLFYTVLGVVIFYCIAGFTDSRNLWQEEDFHRYNDGSNQRSFHYGRS